MPSEDINVKKNTSGGGAGRGRDRGRGRGRGRGGPDTSTVGFSKSLQPRPPELQKPPESQPRPSVNPDLELPIEHIEPTAPPMKELEENLNLKQNTKQQAKFINNKNYDSKMDKSGPEITMDFGEIQYLFKILYKIITYFILVLVIFVFLLSLVNLILMIINIVNDELIILANDDVMYRELNKFKWLKYITINYENYNILKEDTLIYSQQIILNAAIYLIFMIIVLGICNVSFYSILKLILGNKMKGVKDPNNNEYFIHSDIVNIFAVCFLFCFICAIVYAVGFYKLIFNPIKNMNKIN